MYVYIRSHIHTHTHTCIQHAYTYIHTYTHTYSGSVAPDAGAGARTLGINVGSKSIFLGLHQPLYRDIDTPPAKILKLLNVCAALRKRKPLWCACAFEIFCSCILGWCVRTTHQTSHDNPSTWTVHVLSGSGKDMSLIWTKVWRVRGLLYRCFASM
jgi:hypothetical protein